MHNKNKASGYVKAVIGAVFLIKKEVIEKIGLFDEVYLPFFKEETDFCERAILYGYKTYYVNNTNITHLEGYSTTKAKIKRKWSKEYISYISIRNDWIFLLRWYKYLILPNLLYDFVQAFIYIDPKFGFRTFKEIRSRLKFTLLGLINALKEYKKTKIPSV
jgi:GT2 family glycosyltransferase